MTSRSSPMTRERPVRTEKIAVFRAMPLPVSPPPGGAGTTGSSPKGSALADKAAIVRRPVTDREVRVSGRMSFAPREISYGKHPLTEEADPALRARAHREPPLHLDDQDALPSPRV